MGALSRIIREDTRYLSASEVLGMLGSMASRMDDSFTPDRLVHWRYMGDYSFKKCYGVFVGEAYLEGGEVPFIISPPWGEQQAWDGILDPFNPSQEDLQGLLKQMNVIGETSGELVAVDYKISFEWD
jgi:hypothetical protein